MGCGTIYVRLPHRFSSKLALSLLKRRVDIDLLLHERSLSFRSILEQRVNTIIDLLRPFEVSYQQVQQFSNEFFQQVDSSLRDCIEQEYPFDIKRDLSFSTTHLTTDNYEALFQHPHNLGEHLIVHFTSDYLILMLLELKSKQHIQHICHEYIATPSWLKKVSGQTLFRYICHRIRNFCTIESLNIRHLSKDGSTVPLSFIFPYSCQHHRLDAAILLAWSNDFTSTDLLRSYTYDIGKVLNTCLTELQLPFHVSTILSDATAILFDHRWKSRSTLVSCYTDTSFTLAYIEPRSTFINVKNEALQRYLTENDPNDMMLAVTVETYGDQDFSSTLEKYLLTDYDVELDRICITPGTGRLQKMFTIRFLGELVRLIINDLKTRHLILQHTNSKTLLSRSNEFSSHFLNEIDHDSNDYKQCRRIFQLIGYSNVTTFDCAVLRYIVHLIIKRAASIWAVILVTFVERTQQSFVGILCDGALVRQHTTMYRMMKMFAKRLVKKEIDIDFIKTERGPSYGAVLASCT